MSKFNFTGLLAVAKALHETTTKHDTKAVIISNEVKNDTTIEFKNSSYIKVLTPKGKCSRGNRSKIIYPLCNGDDTVNYSFDEEMFDEVLASFCNKEDNK